MAAPTPTPTPTLTLPQIQFLNHFLYSKPPSFRNPNTLFRALQKPPHFYTFNLLHLSFPLIRVYTSLLHKRRLPIVRGSSLQQPYTYPAPRPSLPRPPQLPKQGRFKKFTNFLKKTFKKKSVAPAPPAIIPQQPTVPTLSIPPPVSNTTPIGIIAPRPSPKAASRRYSRRRHTPSSPHSSDSERSHRRLISSDSPSTERRLSIEEEGSVPRKRSKLAITAHDVDKRLKEREDDARAKESAELKRRMPVLYAMQKGFNYAKTKTKKKFDSFRRKRAERKESSCHKANRCN